MLFKRFKYPYPLIIFILTLVFFTQPIFNPSFMFSPSQDIVTIFSQEKELVHNSIKIYNTLPLWNPYIFGGSPFLGNPTSSMFYPLNVFFMIFPVKIMFGYMFIIDTFLIGLFTYLFARIINVSKFSSFITAIIIMFSGPMLTLIFPGHLINFDTFIWFPLILLFYELAITRQKMVYGVTASVPIALSLLAGASQIAVFSLFSSFAYYLLRTIMSIPSDHKFTYFSKAGLTFFLSIAIGFLLSAIQIIPSSEFSGLSARAQGISYQFASDFSLHPKQLISFLLPYFFGNPKNGTYWGVGNFWELNGYIGIVPLLLAPIAILRKKSQHILIFSALGSFALFFSFGKFSFVFPFFYDHFPIFNSFRVPARFLYVYGFSVSILAGIGMDLLIKKLIKRNISLIFVKIILLVGSIFLIASLISYYKGGILFYEKFILKNTYAVGVNHNNLFADFTKGIMLFSIFLICFSIFVFLKLKNRINTISLKSLLALTIILDLWIFNYQIISFKKNSDMYGEPNFIKEIKKDSEIFRIFDKTNLYLPSAERNKIENITGVHSLYIRDYRDFIWSIGEHANTPYESFFQINKIEHSIFLDLLNVKYIIADNKLIKNTSFLPRAYIVPNAIVLSKQETLDKLKSKDFDPKNRVVLQKNPSIKLNNQSSYKKVEIVNREPNKIQLRTSLDNPGFLVLSEIYYPGWKAYDNGKATEIYKADYILRSISLKKGRHEIIFIYSPDSYKTGLTISLSAFLLLLLYLSLNKKTFVDLKRLFP